MTLCPKLLPAAGEELLFSCDADDIFDGGIGTRRAMGPGDTARRSESGVNGMLDCDCESDCEFDSKFDCDDNCECDCDCDMIWV